MKDTESPDRVFTGFTNFTRVRELFDQAQDMAPDQFANWLDSVCAGDPDLLGELQAMLMAW